MPTPFLPVVLMTFKLKISLMTDSFVVCMILDKKLNTAIASVGTFFHTGEAVSLHSFVLLKAFSERTKVCSVVNDEKM